MKKNDVFYLYDLRVTTKKGVKSFVCSHEMNSYFDVIGERIVFSGCKDFSLYVMSALLPLLPVKQRDTVKNDWVSTDDFIACPDPNCGGIFLIERLGRRRFKHSEVTVTKV